MKSHQEALQRSEYLDALYLIDGRDEPDHPSHGLYTGLYQERIKQLLLIDRELTLEDTRFW